VIGVDYLTITGNFAWPLYWFHRGYNGVPQARDFKKHPAIKWNCMDGDIYSAMALALKIRRRYHQSRHFGGGAAQ
jgi:hypothetical protein